MLHTQKYFEVELEGIQERYVQVLRSYLEHASPHHPGRLQELFARIPEVLPSGKAIDSDLYCEQLMRLKREVEKKEPKLINRMDPGCGEPAAGEQDVLRTFRAKLCGDQIVHGPARRLVLDVLARAAPRRRPVAYAHRTAHRLVFSRPAQQCSYKVPSERAPPPARPPRVRASAEHVRNATSAARLGRLLEELKRPDPQTDIC
ncbi:Hormone receptor 4 [Eumeta japonica]|uniref:Hormone receptor 4 n=1 Tax=Eumeta variegata TaxID=151549 RepID=A0A4C1UUJ5_EUMVA|nr:Hormone receptor 4 [Eumeta japonica]